MPLKEEIVPLAVAVAPTASDAGEADSRGTDLELTVLMPCLNEAETIGTCVRKATDFLKRNALSGEVLIADNGSTDGSMEIARALGARIVSVPTRGYGAALISGIAAARGTYVIMGDADDSYDFVNLMPFLEQLRSGSDLVMGNRFRGGIADGAMPFLHRYLGNPVLSWLGRLLYKIDIGDFHCGLRGFRRDAVAGLRLEASGMEFASEMVVRSALRGLRISEVPTTLKPDGRTRPPHLRTWRDGWRHLKFLLLLSPKWLFFYPGIVLAVTGCLLSLFLLSGPRSVGSGIVLDLNSFLAACMFTVVGIQLIAFGALARTYASQANLLPPGRRSALIARLFTTDRLMMGAGVLLLVGIILFMIPLAIWMRVGFGNLEDPLIPRLVIAGLCTIVVAVQTGFSAFLFDLMSMARREKG